MGKRILCAFDSPETARAAVPRALELGAVWDAEIYFLGVLRTERGEAVGPVAPSRVRRHAFLSIVLAWAGDEAARAGVLAGAGLVHGNDLERKAVLQAVAQRADAVLLGGRRGLRRRPYVRRLSLRRAGAPAPLERS